MGEIFFKKIVFKLNKLGKEGKGGGGESVFGNSKCKDFNVKLSMLDF